MSRHTPPTAPTVSTTPDANHRVAPEPTEELPRHREARVHWLWLLSHRLLGFAIAQALIAGILIGFGPATGWADSIPWWPVAAVMTNLFTIAFLVWVMRSEGRRYRELFRLHPETVWRDLGAVLLLAIGAGILVVAPNFGLATLLFGDAEAPLEIFVQALPLWVAIGTVVLFPTTIALSELALYFGYLRPRIERAVGSAWVAVGLTASFLALQHAALPLVFDWRFITWRTLMFVPLALLFGIGLRWRPRLLPYLAVLHGLADLQIVLMVLDASR